MSEFCSTVENRKRCVLSKEHVGRHDLQPFGALSVQIIEKQEVRDSKLERVPSKATVADVPKVVPVLDETVTTTGEESTTSSATFAVATETGDSK